MLIDSIRFRVRRSNPIDSDQIIPSISHIIIAHFNRSRVIFQRLILGLFGKTEPVFFLPIEWPLVSIIESVRFDRWRFRGGIERILRRPRARIASRAPSTKNRPSPFTQKLRKRKKNRWTRLFVLFCFVFYRVLPSLKKPDRPDYARPPSLRLLCGHLSGLRSFSLFFCWRNSSTSGVSFDGSILSLNHVPCVTSGPTLRGSHHSLLSPSFPSPLTLALTLALTLGPELKRIKPISFDP